jgi:hypothetical protein
VVQLLELLETLVAPVLEHLAVVTLVEAVLREFLVKETTVVVVQGKINNLHKAAEEAVRVQPALNQTAALDLLQV